MYVLLASGIIVILFILYVNGYLNPVLPESLAYIEDAPVTTITVDPTPVTTIPVDPTPVDPTPVMSTPVMSTPVMSTPVMTTPVMTTPVMSTPSILDKVANLFKSDPVPEPPAVEIPSATVVMGSTMDHPTLSEMPSPPVIVIPKVPDPIPAPAPVPMYYMESAPETSVKMESTMDHPSMVEPTPYLIPIPKVEVTRVEAKPVDPMQPWLADPSKYRVIQGNIFANGTYAIARGSKADLPAMWEQFVSNPSAHSFVVKYDAVVIQTFPTSSGTPNSFVKVGTNVADYVTYSNVDWPGFGDFGSAPADDLYACKQLCSGVAACDFAAYGGDHNCYLKRRVIEEPGTFVIIKSG